MKKNDRSVDGVHGFMTVYMVLRPFQQYLSYRAVGRLIMGAMELR